MSYKYVCTEIEKNIIAISEKLDRDTRIYLFGANQYAGFIINCTHQNGTEVECIIDNDIAKQGMILNSKRVVSIAGLELRNCIVLIASQYYESMEKQIKGISNEVDVISLFDFVSYNKQDFEDKQFWNEEVFNKNLYSLESGEKVYKSLYEKCLLVISPTTSIGDQFLWNIYFDQYLKENGEPRYKVVVASKAAAKVIQLFENRSVEIISEIEMKQLVEFVMYFGEDKTNSLLIYPRYEFFRRQDIIADWTGKPWQRIYAEYIFKLKTIKTQFPRICDDNLENDFFYQLGYRDEKTIIISPYANTVGELSVYFWEELVEKLVERKFVVFTNVAGNQKAIKGTTPLNIPFNQSGNYLDNAEYFISIRNGLCDIVGQSECKKIIIFNNRRQLFTSEINYNDLRVDDIARNCKYIINEIGYEDITLNKIIRYLDSTD